MTLAIGKFKKTSIAVLGKSIDYLSMDDESVVSIQNLKLLDSYMGPTSFDYCLIDYKDLFKPYIKYSMTIQEVNKFVSDNSWLKIIGDRSGVKQALAVVSKIAESDIEEVKKSGQDVIYRRQLAFLCKDLGEYVDGVSNSNDEHIVVPLRGGLLVASLLPGFDLRRVIPIDCKRLPLSRDYGNFAFGMSFRYFSKNTKELLIERYSQSKGSTLRILEVAVGSGITTIGMILDLYSRDLLPKTIRLISPIITIPGLSLVKQVCDQFGIELECYTASVFGQLGDFYNDRNDSIIGTDGKYVVGNASSILEKFLHLSDLEGIFSSSQLTLPS